MLHQQVAEHFRRHDGDIGRLHRGDRGRARLLVDCRQLAELSLLRMMPSVTSRPAGEKVTAAAAPLSTKNTSRVRLPLSSNVSALA